MATLNVAYFKWRNGRPRWEPGPGVRALGFRGQDLKSPTGEWLEKLPAMLRATELNGEVKARKAQGPRRPRIIVDNPRGCRALWKEYKESPRWTRLDPITQRDYNSKAGIWLEEFGDKHVSALEHHHLYTWWEEMHSERGHAMANGTVAVARLVLSYAVKKGWLTVNPARNLGLDGVPPRCVVWTPTEIDALMKAADTLKLPGVGDAIIIALHTGQRQGDVLALEAPQIANGRALFRQSKRGARVSVPLTPQLQARLAEINERRRKGVVTPIAKAWLVLNTKGLPYTRETFGIDWRAVRAEAVKELAKVTRDARGFPCTPGAAHKLFLDLRDTAITRLALAGCTIPEIRAITGHSMETIHKILKHYLALDDRMATSAIERLRIWMAEEGIAV